MAQETKSKKSSAKAGTKNLVIVESPAKAKTIEKYLGPDYEVAASMGHVRDLPKTTLGIDTAHGFTPQYILISGKGARINSCNAVGQFVFLCLPCLGISDKCICSNIN